MADPPLCIATVQLQDTKTKHSFEITLYNSPLNEEELKSSMTSFASCLSEWGFQSTNVKAHKEGTPNVALLSLFKPATKSYDVNSLLTMYSAWTQVRVSARLMFIFEFFGSQCRLQAG
jgi:hypothetical protein